jgi:hypothetical protein
MTRIDLPEGRRPSDRPEVVRAVLEPMAAVGEAPAGARFHAVSEHGACIFRFKPGRPRR